jgi:hypothetical protein
MNIEFLATVAVIAPDSMKSCSRYVEALVRIPAAVRG